MEIEVDHFYTIKTTPHTQQVSETIRFNICGRRAWIIGTWLGNVLAKVSMGRGQWTPEVRLVRDDLEDKE